MLNTLNKNFGKKVKIGILSLGSAMLFSGCGEGGTYTVNSLEYLVGKSQAGAISGADINIEYEGVILYTTTTNESGEYKILKRDLEAALKNNGFATDIKLSVFSVGGVDIDPDDNGILDDDVDKIVYGEMKSLMNISEINNSVITPISSLIHDILYSEDGANLDSLRNINGLIDQVKLKERIQTIIGLKAKIVC